MANKITRISETDKNALKRKTAAVLPDNPAACGMKAAAVKPKFWQALTEGDDSVAGLLNRIITEANAAFNESVMGVSVDTEARTITFLFGDGTEQTMKMPEGVPGIGGDSPIKYGEGKDSAVSGTSKAIGTESVSIGSDNLAGSKAFTIIGLDEATSTYTLDSVKGLDVGDVYSLRLACYNAATGESDAPQRYNVGAITAIDTTTNTVTVDTMFKPSDFGDGFVFRYVENFADENGIDYETNAFRIIEKPLVGTRTIGSSTIALGSSNQALSKNAVAEGWGNTAYGSHAHAEGYSTEASYAAHSEGKNTVASGSSSHSEGEDTVASGNMSHAEGRNTEATAHFAHAEGYYTEASGNQSHAEGSNTHATNYNAHAEGYDTTASGDGAHAEGTSTKATAKDAHAEGNATEATAVHTHAEGQRSKAQHNSAHAEGFETVSAGDASHSEGYQTKASDENRHRGAHAEGVGTEATGSYYDNTYIGAHAEGYKTKATAVAAHAEGKQTVASGKFAHAEGNSTKSTNNSTHAEGWSTTASGENAHAEGAQTVASGNNSHAGGKGTKATVEGQYAVGLYNAEDPDAVFLAGNGNSDAERSNAFGVRKDGRAFVAKGPSEPMDLTTKQYVTDTLEQFEDSLRRTSQLSVPPFVGRLRGVQQIADNAIPVDWVITVTPLSFSISGYAYIRELADSGSNCLLSYKILAQLLENAGFGTVASFGDVYGTWAPVGRYNPEVVEFVPVLHVSRGDGLYLQRMSNLSNSDRSDVPFEELDRGIESGLVRLDVQGQVLFKT